MPVDPRINCAAEICCPPENPAAAEVSKSCRARMSILMDLGVPEELAPKVADEMGKQGVVFLTSELATAIRHIAFPEEE